MKEGKLFVLEGMDGSGKGTQAELLISRLRKESFKVHAISFPRHGEKSAEPVDLYLTETVAPKESFSPYHASLLYAVDRSFARFDIEKWVADGTIVVLDRYVGSNAGHQGARIENENERKDFLRWLYETEYEKLGLLKPKINIVLHLPAAIAQKRVGQKNLRLYLGEERYDAHERDLEYLKRVEMAYLWLCKEYPNEYTCIGVDELSPDEVHEKVWSVVKNYIYDYGREPLSAR